MTNENIRDCENCKHFILHDRAVNLPPIHACEEWECKFERRTNIETNKINFPKSIWEFILDNSFKDTEEVYTNGALLSPTFRVKQAIEHYYEPIEESEDK